MKKMILLFSHKLSDEQRRDAQSKLGVTEFIILPDELQKVWSNVPSNLDSILQILQPVKMFLLENSSVNDTVLIHGDFGMVYNMVNFCKQNKLIPVYATTKRDSVEYVKNNKTLKESIFEFRRFREYE